MDYNRNNRLLGPVIFYVDDNPTNAELPRPDLTLDVERGRDTGGIYPPDEGRHSSRSNSVYSQPGRSKRPRTIVDPTTGETSLNIGARRSSLHAGAGRSRTNSCSGPTPLGDGRRASVCRKNPRTRRGSNVQRKSSIHTTIGKSGAVAVNAVAEVAKVPIHRVQGNPVGNEQDRHRKKIVMIILGIFLFLLVASVLVVVVTLTHSSFHSVPNDAAKELEAHRNNQLRKENEELLNSLSRDNFVPENVTTLP